MAHSWKPPGYSEAIRDNRYSMYYRGEKIKRAVFRGQTVWEQESKPQLGTFSFKATISWRTTSSKKQYGIRRVIKYNSPERLIVGTNLKIKINDSPILEIGGQTLFGYANSDSSIAPFLNISTTAQQYFNTNDLNENYFTIYGESFSAFSFRYLAITEVYSPLPKELNAFTNLSGLFRQTFLSYIPNNLFINLPNVTDMSYVFANSLISSIPTGLFDNQPQITNFDGTFANTNISSIPSNLFNDKRSITSFYYTFANCEALVSIPDNLFNGCDNAITFASCFEGCSSLQSIPDNLFNGCDHVTTFAATFKNSGIRRIPLIFRTCASANVFTETFYGCRQLIEISSGLFDDIAPKPQVQRTFAYCSALSSIPDRLFSNFHNYVAFMSTFKDCTNLSSIPSNLFSHLSKTLGENTAGPWYIKTLYSDIFHNTFENCTSLTNLPEALFTNLGGRQFSQDALSLVSMFSYTFAGCSNIVSVPKKIFSNVYSTPQNDSVLRFLSTFANCTSLSNVDISWLDDNQSCVLQLESVFENCTSLTALPAELFTNGQRYMFTATFKGCVNLRSIPAKEQLVSPLAWVVLEEIISTYPPSYYAKYGPRYKEMFSGCTALESNAPDFWTIISSDSRWTIVGTECFHDCTNVANYADIPSNWK